MAARTRKDAPREIPNTGIPPEAETESIPIMAEEDPSGRLGESPVRPDVLPDVRPDEEEEKLNYHEAPRFETAPARSPWERGGQSQPITSDPLADLFGPGSGRVLREDPNDAIPDAVVEAINQNNLGAKEFRCAIFEVESEGEHAGGRFVSTWASQVPSVQYVAKRYGPGHYVYAFTFNIARTEGHPRYRTIRVPFSISEKGAIEHKKFKTEEKIKALKEKRERMQDEILDQVMEEGMTRALIPNGAQAPGKSPMEAGKEYVKDIVEASQMLGLQRGGTDWGPIMALATAALPAIVTAMTESAKQQQTMMMAMITMMNQNHQGASSQLLEALKISQGSGLGTKMTQEYMDMIKGILDIKQMVEGDKETIADKIFRLIEGVAPMLLTIVANPRAPQAAPMVGMAKNFMAADPNFQAMAQDPEILAALVKKLDAFYGWEQTDGILAVAGQTRPPSCPKMDTQRYHAEDPRNGVRATVGATVGATDPVARTRTGIGEDETEDDHGIETD